VVLASETFLRRDDARHAPTIKPEPSLGADIPTQGFMPQII
jgi:hypothetical protein